MSSLISMPKPTKYKAKGDIQEEFGNPYNFKPKLGATPEQQMAMARGFYGKKTQPQPDMADMMDKRIDVDRGGF